MSAATGCDALVDSPVVEMDCEADCGGGELVSAAEPVKLVWLAVASALPRSIAASDGLGAAAKVSAPALLICSNRLSGIGLGSTANHPQPGTRRHCLYQCDRRRSCTLRSLQRTKSELISEEAVERRRINLVCRIGPILGLLRIVVLGHPDAA